MEIGSGITIDEREICEEFVRASGPGGQNVNKVATAVQLRFNVCQSPSLPDEVRRRLLNLAAGQITSEGVLVIDCRRYRSQARNREGARGRLAELVALACRRPKTRRRTAPTMASRERRLDVKRQRSLTKGQRQRPGHGDE